MCKIKSGKGKREVFVKNLVFGIIAFTGDYGYPLINGYSIGPK
jgi:hypothetical protein